MYKYLRIWVTNSSHFIFAIKKIKVDNVFDIQWDEKTKLADLDW